MQLSISEQKRDVQALLKLAHNEKVRKNTDQTTDMNLHKIITLKKSKIELDEIV